MGVNGSLPESRLSGHFFFGLGASIGSRRTSGIRPRQMMISSPRSALVMSFCKMSRCVLYGNPHTLLRVISADELISILNPGRGRPRLHACLSTDRGMSRTNPSQFVAAVSPRMNCLPVRSGAASPRLCEGIPARAQVCDRECQRFLPPRIPRWRAE